VIPAAPPPRKWCLLWKNVEKYFVAGQAKDENGVCSLHARHLELQIPTQYMYLLFLCCNDGCTNDVQRCMSCSSLCLQTNLVYRRKSYGARNLCIVWNSKPSWLEWLSVPGWLAVPVHTFHTQRFEGLFSLSSRQSLQLNATRSCLLGKKSAQSGLSDTPLPVLRSLYQELILPVDGLLCLEDGGFSPLRNFANTPHIYAALFSQK